jgi:CHAT domain-containing protein
MDGIEVELAIQAYQAALEVYTRHDFPFEWAHTQHDLGVAYWNRIKGDRKDNIELAIQALQSALKVRTRRDFPLQWADTQYNLGVAYWDRIEGDRKDNIELAIQAYLPTVEVKTQHDFPLQWAKIKTNLGIAYWSRIEGDRKDNIELAIQAFQAVLEVFTRNNCLLELAQIQHNLGTAYWNRIKGDRKDNIEHAIQAFQSALKMRTRHNFPIEWANTQNNLGNAYFNRIKGDRKDNIELAIQAFQSALEVRTRHNFPIEWANTQNGLGAAFSDRSEGDQADNIELAIQAFQSALEVKTRHNFHIEWAMTQNNLGSAYQRRIKGNRKDNFELAIQAYRSALQVNQPELLPYDCLVTGCNLGNLAFHEEDWPIAIEGFEQAITAVEKSRSWVISDRRRQEILDEAIGIYEKMLQSCINADRLDLALQTIERVRSKRLVDLMAAPDLYRHGEIPAPVQLILESITNIQQQMGDLSQVESANTPELIVAGTRDRAAVAPPTLEIQTLEAQKQALIDQLSRYDTVSGQLVEISPPDITQIQTKLLDRSDLALLSFYTTTQDTYILIVYSDSIQCFTCPGQGIGQLQTWLIEEWAIPYPIRPIKKKNQTSKEEEDAWREKYQEYLDKKVEWQEKMPKQLQQLAEKLDLNCLITEHLNGIQELILIPHLLLHLVPFAAIPLQENQYLGDRFRLRYAPGCQVLKFCADRDELLSQQQYGTVENATEDLPFAAIEGEAITQIFQIDNAFRLRGQEATIDAYKQLLNQVNSVVSSHHAQSRLDNPLESALLLANGRRVTLADLLSPAWRFADLNDVFLSCCETGMTVPESFTDELLTLGTGFLCAGARSVVSSLWSVDDLATTIFSEIYHQYRAKGDDRIAALQEAQKELRSISGDQLRDISEAKYTPVLIAQLEQLEQCRKDARRQKKQATPSSETYQQWEAEEKHYGDLMHPIENAIQNLEAMWEEPLPFDHPVYWAAFTCQGLR